MEIGEIKDLNPKYRDKLFQLINESAFPNHLDMKIIDIDHGTCVFVMSPQEYRLQPFGVMHGGNYAIIVDSAAFWACYLAMGDDRDALTSIDLQVNYLAPVRQGKLRCQGQMIKEGRTLFFAEARVFSDTGTLVAHGTSSLMRIPNKGLRLGIPMFHDSEQD